MTLSTRCQTFDIRDAPSITQTRYNVDFQAHYKNNINIYFKYIFTTKSELRLHDKFQTTAKLQCVSQKFTQN